MSNIKNPLIFLVDDDPGFRKMIDAYLKQNRLSNIKQFASGEEMLEQLAKEKPTIVIQDFDLGTNKLTGIETFRKAKTIIPKINFIFLSGQTSISIAVEIIKSGAFDYVVKDEAAKENLLNRIKKIIYMEKLMVSQKVYKIGTIAFLGIIFIVFFTCYLLGVKLVFPE